MRGKGFRGFLSVLTAILLAVGFTACNGGGKANEIVVWMEGEGPAYADVTAFAEYFEENNPWGYTMSVRMQTSVSASLVTSVMSGNAADLVLWPRWETSTQAKDGDMLVNLKNRIAASPELNMDGINAKALAECTIDANVYAIPTDVGGWGVWCNMDIFEEAGLTEDDLPETWTELLEVAKLLAKKEDGRVVRAGFDVTGIRGQLYSMLLTADKHEYVKQNAAGVGYVDLDNAAGRAFFQFVDDLNKADIFAVGLGGADAVSNFAQGNLAMMFGSNYFEKQLAAVGATDMNLRFVPNPKCDDNYLPSVNGVHSGILGGFSLAVPVNLKNTDRSWDVMKWWLEAEHLAKYTELVGELPSRDSLWERDYVRENYINSVLMDVVEDFEIRPPILGYSYFEMNVIFAQMDLFLGGSIDAAAAIREITTRGNAILNEFATAR